ncbi:reelin [Limosa lapponica baueri]|uniref:Reelin n=1 Tax=Limosa lapponica baueri TaxID=1758121 RepID=A0A2I0U6S2_LIMLA|nr:reelin [Limosa lapponica baueri]
MCIASECTGDTPCSTLPRFPGHSLAHDVSSMVTISTSTFFDGLLVTGLYTSTSVQASQSVGGSSAFGFAMKSLIPLGAIHTPSLSGDAFLTPVGSRYSSVSFPSSAFDSEGP